MLVCCVCVCGGGGGVTLKLNDKSLDRWVSGVLVCCEAQVTIDMVSSKY